MNDTQASSQCPLCGDNFPHNHSETEVARLNAKNVSRDTSVGGLIWTRQGMAEDVLGEYVYKYELDEAQAQIAALQAQIAELLMASAG